MLRANYGQNPWQERDQLNQKFAAEQQAVAEARRHSEDLESRLRETTAELERVHTELTRHAEEQSHLESEQRTHIHAGKTATEKAEAVDKASKRLTYTVVLNEDQGGFKFNKSELPAEAQERLDQLVNDIKADPKGAFFEIEGHTDNIGTKDVNDRVGLERAKAVERYLYEHHQIPLHRMNVISYGQDKPVAPNTTKEGRAQNRRIVIKVLI